MLLTLLYYVLIIAVISLIKNTTKSLALSCVLIALYLGLRYNYMPDYMAYYSFFNMCSFPSYIYTDSDHMEYGWFVLNKIFSPFGFFFFVFFCSCLLAYSIYLTLKPYANKQTLLLVVFGLVSNPGLAVLSSAQRQFVVTAIFLIAFYYLIKDRIFKLNDIIKFKTITYFIIIYICSYIHGSAVFLFLVPFLYLIPSKSNIVLWSIILLFIFEVALGRTYLPVLLESYVSKTSTYDYVAQATAEIENYTFLGMAMYIFQITLFCYTYRYSNITKSEQLIIIIAILMNMLYISTYSIAQIYRIGFYFLPIGYAAIGLVLYKIKNKYIYISAAIIYIAWIIWVSIKLFSIRSGTFDEYKTIFSAL